MSNLTAPWNKGRAVGQRLAFSASEVRAIAHSFNDDADLHDKCLFMIAVDSFLRSGDLLKLQVRDVASTSGEIRQKLIWRQQKTAQNVYPVLTLETQRTCAEWVKHSGKLPDHFLFTRSKAIDAPPISTSSYRQLVKQWAERIGLHGEHYSSHSLRRSKPSWLYARGVAVEDISQLLGHKSTVSTMHYLGLTLAKAQAEALKHDIFQPEKFDETRKTGR